MIYIQKPDGTVLTWFEKVQMFIRIGIITEWSDIVSFQDWEYNSHFISAVAVATDPKKNYYWDYAGDVLRDANFGEHGHG